MIYIKENTDERTKDWKDEEIYILADFDKTITLGSSSTSWSILSKSDMVPKNYVEERNVYYDHYRPIEIDETLDYDTKNRLMKEWWEKHINLFVKYKISEEIINKAAKDLRVMSFREGAKEFLTNMKQREIPVIIISAGIGNFIKQFLIDNEVNYDNIYIVSNFIKFENGYAIGVEDNITHSLNKNEVSMPEQVKIALKERKHIILLGDGISDIRMASEEKREEALKIGFLEEKQEENLAAYRNAFDLVGTDNTGFSEIKEQLKVLKR
ncbi:MAG: HAD-IB family phosphatase [Bacilli bacterium]|nr:HAD-IB family phosphatase [Bacilli bacterium]